MYFGVDPDIIVMNMEKVDCRQYSVVSKKKIRTFQDLGVWEKAHNLVLEIYKTTAGFPKEEIYGLTSQMRRASISVPANIAEGFSRRSNNDKAHFYNIAQSSLHEVKYYLVLVKDLGFVKSDATNSTLWSMSNEVGKMLYRLIEAVKPFHHEKT